MWDVPHNLIMPQDNRLAVGISAPGETSHENVYKEMFEGRGLGDSRIKYRCRVFQKELSPIECSDDKMVVTGSIGGDCRTTAKISVKPQRLAKSPQTEHSYSDRE
nr:hypothetical protein BaRGS_021510 [Batillaria attramentaria]